MRVTSKANEILRINNMLHSNVIGKNEYKGRLNDILTVPYREYDGGIEPEQEIELLKQLVTQRIISRSDLHAQANELLSFDSPKLQSAPEQNGAGPHANGNGKSMFNTARIVIVVLAFVFFISIFFYSFATSSDWKAVAMPFAFFCTFIVRAIVSWKRKK